MEKKTGSDTTALGVEMVIVGEITDLASLVAIIDTLVPLYVAGDWRMSWTNRYPTQWTLSEMLGRLAGKIFDEGQQFAVSSGCMIYRDKVDSKVYLAVDPKLA